MWETNMLFHTYRLMEAEDAAKILELLKEQEWKQGKARTEALTGTVKQNLEITDNIPMVQAIARSIGERIRDLPDIQREWMPAKLAGVKFNRYEGGGTYNRHTDAPMMGDVRTDISCTIFLTPPEDYDGGELCMVVDGIEYRHKGQQGECVVYPCGHPHWVTPVTRGSRISGITWIQSFVRDPKQRKTLQNVLKVSTALEKRMNLDDAEDFHRELFVDVGQVHGDLMRMWLD